MSYNVSRVVLFFGGGGATAQTGLDPPHFEVYKSHRRKNIVLRARL